MENILEKKEKHKKPKMYQWIKTERAGEYVYEDYLIEEDGETYIVFTDGSRVNIKLIGDYFVRVEDENDGYIVKEEIHEEWIEAKDENGKTHKIPGMMHGHKTIKLIPKKRNTETKEIPIENKKDSENRKIEKDPLFLLLKEAKKEKQKFVIEFNIDTISKEFYNILKNTFNDAEEKILDYIISIININDIKNQIKQKIKEFYNEKENNI